MAPSLLWKIECTTLPPAGRLTAPSSVVPGFLVANYNCVSYSTIKFKSGFIRPNKSRKDTLSACTHAKSTCNIPFSNLDNPYSLHQAVLVRMVATSYAAECDECSF
jgi:hypothetical protein